MVDSCQHGSVLRNALTRPLRPHKRDGKHLVRQHPYRRCQGQERVVASRAEARHNSNGHTAVIPSPGSANVHVPASDLHDLLAQVAAGLVSPDTAAHQVVRQVGEDLGQQTTDNGTAADQLFEQLSVPSRSPESSNEADSGASETTETAFQAQSEASTSWDESSLPEHMIWGLAKTARQLAVSLQRCAQKGFSPMAARVSPEIAEEVQRLLPEAQYSATAQALTHPPSGLRQQQRLPGTVAIVSDGSGEEYVMEEARIASSAMGCYAYKLGGVSRGGLSNILPNISAVQSADVVIVIAGAANDHSLVQVVAGSTESPVIAIPVEGSAILAPPGVTCVAQNNGMAAAIFAARILRSASKFRPAA